MIDRTIIERMPKTSDALLAYTRRGEANAFTYIPDVLVVEVGYVMCGHRAIIDIMDDEGFPHTIEAPVAFAQSVMEPREWALERLRSVLRARWN